MCNSFDWLIQSHLDPVCFAVFCSKMNEGKTKDQSEDKKLEISIEKGSEIIGLLTD